MIMVGMKRSIIFLDNKRMLCYFITIKKDFSGDRNGHYESDDKRILVAQQLYNLRV